MDRIKDAAVNSWVGETVALVEQLLDRDEWWLFRSTIVPCILRAIARSSKRDNYAQVIRLLLHKPRVDWRRTPPNSVMDCLYDYEDFPYLNDQNNDDFQKTLNQLYPVDRVIRLFERVLRQERNAYVATLVSCYLSLRAAMPRGTPREVIKMILFRAQYEHFSCVKSGAIPSFQLIRLMELLGLTYNGVAAKSEVCLQVLQVIQRMGLAAPPEMNRLERDIADTLRRQELEEVDRRERKRMKK